MMQAAIHAHVAVECPANTVGENVAEGCSCPAGYEGSVTPVWNLRFITARAKVQQMDMMNL